MSKKIKNYLIALFLIVLSFCFAGFYKTTFYPKAQSTQISVSTFLPQTTLENTALINASAVYRDENLTAIIEDNYKFTIHFADSSIIVNNDPIKLSQMLDVKLFDENTLFFTANARLFAYDLQQKTYSKVSLDGSTDVSVSYFDFNENYLITTYQDKCRIFSNQNGVFTTYSSEFNISNGSNVSINNNNQLFIVGSNGIYKTLANEPGNQTLANTLTEHTPKQIISNDEFLYYVLGGTVHRISINGENHTDLTTLESDDSYDLGKIGSSIKYISFCGDNLLIVENDTIQEYEINDNKLVFTGFAIANGKTAYNRVSKNSTSVQKAYNSMAVLDDFKFTVFTNNNSQNRYARENYKNYLLSELITPEIENSPSAFALGENSALLLYNSNSLNSFVALLDFTKNENFLLKQPPIEDLPFIHDVCYQSGYYYLLCDGGNAPQHVYRAKADEENLDFVKIDNNLSLAEFTMFTVDTYANIYLANKTSVAKLSSDDGYSALTDIGTNFTNITKLQTDLLGRLYVLDGGAIKSIENNTATDYALPKVKSFAFDFVNNDTFILYDDSEFVYSTTELDNASIADLVVPEDFNLSYNPLSPTEANDNLQFFMAKEGANAYVIKKQNLTPGVNFAFDSLGSYTGEYVEICTIKYNGEPKFYALAYQDLFNQDSIALIDISQAQNTNKQIEDLDKTAFVATDVNCYYLPIITPNDTYALNNNQATIRLSKATPISVKKKLSFLDCDYYYAEFSLSDTTYKGYIPCAFTVDVLTGDFEWEQFTSESVKNTWVYKQSDMKEKAFELEENSKVRVLEKGNNISMIAYKNGDVWEIGYIYTSQIIDEPALAIRNILIILAVVACLCGTTTYFLLRKKREPNND